MIANLRNIVKCGSCRAPLIYEELHLHVCFTKMLVSFRVDTNDGKIYAFDGKNWYRWFPPTKANNRRKQPDSEHYQNLGSNQLFSNLLITSVDKASCCLLLKQ